jgi:hypothetical protein
MLYPLSYEGGTGNRSAGPLADRYRLIVPPPSTRPKVSPDHARGPTMTTCRSVEGRRQEERRHRRGTRRRKVGFRAGGVALVGGLILSACNVSIQSQTLTVNSAQEDGFLSNGDEPYVAVIQFRVIPGVPNSTQVHYLGNLQEVGTHMYDGSSATIPDAMGLMSFSNVHMANLPGLLNGDAPEIVGAVTVAMESDASPWSAINGIMNDVASELDTQLRAQIETMSFAQLLDANAASARLSEAASRVQAAASPSFWRGVGIWFSSFGDPDDVIGFKVLFMVGVTSDLSDLVDAKLGTGLPAEVVGRALRTGPLDVNYSGDDANYTIRYNINVQ